MTNKQILNAQKVLRKLESTPVKVYRGDGTVCWQVTYDNETYRDLLNVVTTVANIPVKEPTFVRDTAYESVVDYHRDKI